VLRREERRLQVHVEQQVEPVDGRLVDRVATLPGPRDGRECVDAAVVPDHGGDDCLRALLVGEVTLVEVDVTPRIEQAFLGGPNVGRSHRRPGRPEGLADGTAESARGPGHECYAAAEVELHVHAVTWGPRGR
jgi:hypothetical protein